jgi:hypothetical protein
MAASLLLFAVSLGMPPAQALETALQAVEPHPALRAAFRATLTSGSAVRQIEYDPYAAPDQQFRITNAIGKDDELDQVVNDWRSERQADVRLFADDLRMSLADARVLTEAQGLSIAFRHQIRPNDGPVDKAISSQMIGDMTLDAATGHLQAINYCIERPIKLTDGTVLTDYQQTYTFGYSERWGVSYVMSYELDAKGGKWGMSEARSVRVTLTDVAFGLAGDANQQLVSKPATYTPGLTANLR